ncbi:MAG: hypothetical protein CMJ19_00505 [Phycisphaeraceae bacterium]|nr:hypothetical protein [Phycisphaeraceae bacterium]
MHADINHSMIRGIEPFTNKRHKSNNIEPIAVFLMQGQVAGRYTKKSDLLRSLKVLQFATMYQSQTIIIASMMISTPQPR